MDGRTGVAAITDWHDGDTPHGVIDLGNGLAWGTRISIQRTDALKIPLVVITPQRLRIAGLKAPELKTPGGAEALSHARQLCPAGIYQIENYGFDKYRRPLIDIDLPAGYFSALMIEIGIVQTVSIRAQLAGEVT